MTSARSSLDSSPPRSMPNIEYTPPSYSFLGAGSLPSSCLNTTWKYSRVTTDAPFALYPSLLRGLLSLLSQVNINVESVCAVQVWYLVGQYLI